MSRSRRSKEVNAARAKIRRAFNDLSAFDFNAKPPTFSIDAVVISGYVLCPHGRYALCPWCSGVNG